MSRLIETFDLFLQVEHWNDGVGGGISVTLESHFVHSCHCSSNQLKIAVKYFVNS